MNLKPDVSQPPAIDLAWSEYEDISPSGAMAGIKYPVLLDPRIRTLVEREIDPIEFTRAHRQEPLGIFALTGLRFLLDRFPSMTRSRWRGVVTKHPPTERPPITVNALRGNDLTAWEGRKPIARPVSGGNSFTRGPARWGRPTACLGAGHTKVPESRSQATRLQFRGF